MKRDYVQQCRPVDPAVFKEALMRIEGAGSIGGAALVIVGAYGSGRKARSILFRLFSLAEAVDDPLHSALAKFCRTKSGKYLVRQVYSGVVEAAAQIPLAACGGFDAVKLADYAEKVMARESLEACP